MGATLKLAALRTPPFPEIAVMSAAVDLATEEAVVRASAAVAADVALSMSTGTDVVMETSGTTLIRGDPRLVVGAVNVAPQILGDQAGAVPGVRPKRDRYPAGGLRPAEHGDCRPHDRVQPCQPLRQRADAAPVAWRDHGVGGFDQGARTPWACLASMALVHSHDPCARLAR